MKHNQNTLQAMLLLAENLDYSSTYKQYLIDELKLMLEAEKVKLLTN
jgi:hypothetical protein